MNLKTKPLRLIASSMHVHTECAMTAEIVDEAKPDETETAWVLALATAAEHTVPGRQHSALSHKILFVWEDHGFHRFPWTPNPNSIESITSLYSWRPIDALMRMHVLPPNQLQLQLRIYACSRTVTVVHHRRAQCRLKI